MLLWGIALIGLALLLVAVEVFVPSGGLIAVVSGGAAIGGVVLMWRSDPMWGVSGLLTVIVLGPAVFFYMMSILPNTRAGRMLIGAESEEDRVERELAEQRRRDEQAALIGAEGVALTDLRPVGKIDIDGNRYDALAITRAIDRGSRVRVTDVTIHELKVRPIE